MILLHLAALEKKNKKYPSTDTKAAEDGEEKNISPVDSIK